MARNLSGPAMRALFQSQTDEVFILLLTITTDGLLEPIRVSSDGVDTVSRNELYLAFPFQIDFPSEQEDQVTQIMLRIDNIDRSLVNVIRSATSSPVVQMEMVLDSSPDIVDAGPFDLTLRAVNYDALVIEGTLVYEDIFNQAFPGHNFVPSITPGLF